MSVSLARIGVKLSCMCDVRCRRGRAATHCNTLQYTATHCNALHRTATHCNTLQHTATPDKDELHGRGAAKVREVAMSGKKQKRMGADAEKDEASQERSEEEIAAMPVIYIFIDVSE